MTADVATIPDNMTKKKDTKYKVCDKCGSHCTPSASECGQCHGTRFAPEYIRETRRINRFTSVRVSNPHPESKNTDPVITLSKWWPGGRANFNILNPAQWESISHIIDTEFGPLLGWVSRQTATKRIKESVSTNDLSLLAKQHPKEFAKFVSGLKGTIELPANEEGEKLYAAVADLISQFDRVSVGRVANIMHSLKSGETAGIKQLDDVLSDWSLTQVTSVLRETRRRLGTIELLRQSLQSDSTFELKGTSSIHSILSRDLWLLDESYWMIQSNRTLQTFIGDALSKEDKKKYGEKRPDFVCGSLGDQLIIVELKRPSHQLTKEDLNQMEDYLAVSKKYSTRFRSYKAFLLGSSIPDEVQTYLSFRRGQEVLNYWEVLDNAEKRYTEFLKHREGDIGIDDLSIRPSKNKARMRRL